jgi:beta-xylosidase
MFREQEHMNILKIITIFCLFLIPLPFIDNYTVAREITNKIESTPLACENPGWFPSSFGLKDHHVFQHNGYYYIVSIYLPGEKQFAYARSLDFCTWEDLGPILTASSSDGWESLAKWAPFVLEEDGVYYMYYTGVTESYTQSIMVATSSNPADPNSWTQKGMIFQPSHDNMIWQAGRWADCRDPTVIKIDNLYYMLYTSLERVMHFVP